MSTSIELRQLSSNSTVNNIVAQCLIPEVRYNRLDLIPKNQSFSVQQTATTSQNTQFVNATASGAGTLEFYDSAGFVQTAPGISKSKTSVFDNFRQQYHFVVNWISFNSCCKELLAQFDSLSIFENSTIKIQRFYWEH